MTTLESLLTISKIFAAVVIPVVLAFVGNMYSKAIKEREIQGKFVEIAIGILKEEPEDDNKGIRAWAVEILNRYSGAEFNDDARDKLINTRGLT